MGRSIISFLSLLTISFGGYAQNSVDCNSTASQDSLFAVYSLKLDSVSYNHPDWGTILDTFISICPNIAQAYQVKTIPFLKSGEYEKAFALEDKAVDLDPKSWIAYRGFLHCIFTKNYETAIVDFDRAQQLVPDAFVMDHSYHFFKGLSVSGIGVV